MSTLLILFQVGPHTYGLQSDHVLEIIPAIHLKPILRPLNCVRGSVYYRNHSVLVVDLNSLIINRPSKILLSTRLMLVMCPCGDQSSFLVGLLAENMTNALEVDDNEFVYAHDKPFPAFNGTTLNKDGQSIYCPDLQSLFSEDLIQNLVQKKVAHQ